MASKESKSLNGPISSMDFVSRFKDVKKILLIGDDAFLFTQFVSEEMCVKQNHKGSKSYEYSLLILCVLVGIDNGEKEAILMFRLPESNKKLKDCEHLAGFIYTPDTKEAGKERIMEHCRNSDFAMVCVQIDNSFTNVEPHQISDSIAILHELLTDIQEIVQIPVVITSEAPNLPNNIFNWADKIFDCNVLPDNSKMFSINDITSKYKNKN